MASERPGVPGPALGSRSDEARSRVTGRAFADYRLAERLRRRERYLAKTGPEVAQYRRPPVRNEHEAFRSTVLACGDPPVGAPHANDDILHAIDHSLLVDDLGEDLDRWLLIGPDRATNLLEVILLITGEGDELIIHAMPLRAIYRKLLDS